MRKSHIKSVSHWTIMSFIYLFPIVMIGVSFFAPKQTNTYRSELYYETNDVSSIDDLIVGNIYHCDGKNTDFYSFLTIDNNYYNLYLNCNYFGSVDLGTLDYSYSSPSNYFASSDISDLAIINSHYVGHLLCSNYRCVPYNTMYRVPDGDDLVIAQTSGGSSQKIYIRNNLFDGNVSKFKNAMSGVILYYELSTSSSDSSTSYYFNYISNLDISYVNVILVDSLNDLPYSCDFVYNGESIDSNSVYISKYNGQPIFNGQYEYLESSNYVHAELFNWTQDFINMPINIWYKDLISLLGFNVVNNVMCVLMVYPLYVLWVKIFDLFTDILSVIINICHNFLHKLGGENE